MSKQLPHIWLDATYNRRVAAANMQANMAYMQWVDRANTHIMYVTSGALLTSEQKGAICSIDTVTSLKRGNIRDGHGTTMPLTANQRAMVEWQCDPTRQVVRDASHKKVFGGKPSDRWEMFFSMADHRLKILILRFLVPLLFFFYFGFNPVGILQLDALRYCNIWKKPNAERILTMGATGRSWLSPCWRFEGWLNSICSLSRFLIHQPLVDPRSYCNDLWTVLFLYVTGWLSEV
jgi:hypothetical protein